MSVACVLASRFRLSVALEGRRELLRRPAALAPEPGAAQLIGEVSGPAERLGVRSGMRLGEALSRSPELALVPPDPEGAERAWERVLRTLEGIGAAVESELAGEAFFEAEGLSGLWGGIRGVLARARGAAGIPVLAAAAPVRFCAYAAAVEGRGDRDPAIVPDGEARRFLSPLPVTLLGGRLPDEGEDLPNELERLGVATLGRLAGLSRDAVADRFGTTGLWALKLARGGDEPLCPRRPHNPLAAELELPEASAGQQLGQALELLVARLLVDPERGGRTVRAMRLSARLAGGGGWRRRVAMREASSEPQRLLMALSPLLSLLPSPAAVLRLEATSLGPPAGEQLSLAGPEQQRRRRIGEAVRQARAAGGAEAVLRVLEVDPSSRVPERREVLMPFPEEPSGGSGSRGRPATGDDRGQGR